MKCNNCDLLLSPPRRQACHHSLQLLNIRLQLPYNQSGYLSAWDQIPGTYPQSPHLLIPIPIPPVDIHIQGKLLYTVSDFCLNLLLLQNTRASPVFLVRLNTSASVQFRLPTCSRCMTLVPYLTCPDQGQIFSHISSTPRNA